MKEHRIGHTLRLAEELSCFREIFKDEEGRRGADNGEKSLEDEYPRPAAFSAFSTGQARMNLNWPSSPSADPMFATHRRLEPAPNPDGSLTVHATVHCTLADIARATNLRVEDAAFALNECGLLVRRIRQNGPEDAEPEPEARAAEESLAITREMVEAVAKERDVKRMCMDLAHVLL